MQYTIILAITAAVVIFSFVVIDYFKFRKWLNGASVYDVVNHSMFEANMRITIDDLNNQRAKDAAKAAKHKGRLKSHPIEHLQDEGVFNAKDMTFLYIHSLQKTLCGYSQAERTFIHEVGTMAYNRTMAQMLRRAGMAKIKRAEKD